MTARHTPPPAGKQAAAAASKPAAPCSRQPSQPQLDALLAQYLREHAPPQPEPLSDSELGDVMARLRSRPALESALELNASPAVASRPPQAAANAVAQRASILRQTWQRAMAWLSAMQARPMGGRSGAAGLGWAMPAVAVLGVMLLLAWPDGPTSSDDGASVWQPKGGDGGKAAPMRGLAAPLWLPSPQPEADAAELAAQLSAAGASVMVNAEGRDRVLRVNVPVTASDAVAPVLAAWGLAQVAAGPLEVRVANTAD